METLIKIIVGLKLVYLAVFGLMLVVAVIYTAATDEPTHPSYAPAPVPSWDITPTMDTVTPLPDTDEHDWLTAYPDACTAGTPLASPWDPCDNTPWP